MKVQREFDNVFHCLRSRGLIDNVTSNDDAVVDFLHSSRKIYVGIDPSAGQLHLGNLVPIIVAKWLQIYSHELIILMGGATGMIGDPSGKDAERPLLHIQEIEDNVTKIANSVKNFLPEAKVVNNIDWIKNISLVNFLRDVGQYFRVNNMLTKDSVKNRLNSESGISFSEFSYSLLQGYDFLHLFENEGTTIQIGGSDQWGNIVAGVDLVKKKLQKSVYGLTFPLLLRGDGKKFGKSESGAVWLAEEKCSPYNFYQYFFSIPDTDLEKMLKVLTFLPIKDIKKIMQTLKDENATFNDVKKILATEVTRFVHGEKGVKIACNATKVVKPGSVGGIDIGSLQAIKKDIETIQCNLNDIVGKTFVSMICDNDIVSSKSEIRRLIDNGGLYINEKRMEDKNKQVSSEDILDGKFILLGIGKKRRVLIEIEGDRSG